MLTRSGDYLFTSPNGRPDAIAPRGENQGFLPGSRRDGAAMVANQARRRRKTYGHLSHEGCQAVRENRSKKETVRPLLFFFLYHY